MAAAESAEQLVASLEALIDPFVKLALSDQWKYDKTKDNVKISRIRSSDDPHVGVKGECVIKFCTMKDMFELVQDASKRIPAINGLYEKITTVKELSPNTHIYHALYKSPAALVSPRENLFMETARIIDSGKMGVAVGISRDFSGVGVDIPVTSGYVRMEMKPSGYLFMPHEGKQDEVYLVTVSHGDPKGWLPNWVVNKGASSQALVAGNARKYFAAKAGKPEATDKSNDDDEDEKP